MSEPDDRDMAAAEYVLGTLDASERADVAQRIATDRSWREAVAAWEVRLGPLAEAALSVDVPEHVFRTLEGRLFAPAPAPPGERGAEIVAMRTSLRRWRAASFALAALAACLLLWVGIRPPSEPRTEFVAVLQQDAGQPAILLDVDVRARTLTVRPLGTSAPAGKSLQLWLIDSALGTPRSLGTISARSRTQASLSPFDPAIITGATYAVTVEQEGGSPTGAPTSKPILLGHLAPSS